MGLGYLHWARRKQLPHLSQLYMVKAIRNQRGFYAPPGAINRVDLQCAVLDHFLFFSVSVTMWSALPDVIIVRDREEIKNGLDVLLVLCRIIS